MTESSEINRTETEWALRWDRGSLAVSALGGTMLPRFDLADGRSISPLAVPPWAEERLPPDVPATLAHMRGEWICVPFGAAGPLKEVAPEWRGVSDEIPDGPLHGPAANGVWKLIDRGLDFITIRFEDPSDHPIAWVERHIAVEPGAPAVICTLRIMPRRDAALPVGIHPVLRLPRTTGAMRIRPGAFRFGITSPYLMGEGAPLAGLGRRFSDLSAVPSEGGKIVDFSQPPFAGQYEDAVQLIGASGSVAADNLEERYTVLIEWDRAALPSCILWYSNEGLAPPPWNRRHRALGIEPACAALGLGIKASAGRNPLNAEGESTAIAFTAGQIWQTSYRISVSGSPSARADAPARV
jgi:hypothetical protein